MFDRDFFRPEVWHPLTVHFPIALLPLATITMLISFFVRETAQRHWRIAGSLLLFAGTLLSWVTLRTGDIADGVVARKICDPTILKDHEIAGETMTYLFTGAAVLCVVLLTRLLKEKFRTLIFFAAVLLMLIGTGYLVRTGHLGATLVYDQGAGVRNHSVDCGEY